MSPQPVAHSSLRPVPRVKGRPLLGNLLEFWKRPVGFMVDAFQTYGSVFRFDLPTSHSVVVAGQDARSFLLEQERKSAATSRCPMSRLGLFKPFTTEVGLAVFDAEGETHEELRELLKLPYSRQLTAQFAPEMEQVVADVVSDWPAGQTVDLFQTSCQLALHAMMSVVTPIQMREYSGDFHTAGNRVMYAQFRLLPESSLKTPDYLKARGRMQEVIDEAVSRHAAGEFSGESRVHMIDACLQATNRKGEKMSKEAVRATCFYALAGTEIYMGRLICFLVYELIKNRSYLQRVLAEIDSTESEKDLSNAFRRMPNLRAAYLEALRCYPLIPGYSYLANEDMDVLGHSVKSGEQVVFAPYLGHYAHEQYPNPMAFDPDRHALPRREFARSGMFVPFGVGKHACAAPGLVEMLVLTLTTALLRRVDLQLERPTYQMNVRLNPLITPTEPLLLRVIGPRIPQTKSAVDTHLSESADFHRAHESEDWIDSLPAKQSIELKKGQEIIAQGARADAFYVVLEGTLAVWKRESAGASEIRVASKEPGTCFGEIGILKNVPRTASVRAETDARVLRFDEAEYRALVGEHDLTFDDVRSIYYARYIKELLHSTLHGLGEAVAPELLQWRTLAAGDYMFRQGEISDAFYIVVSGSAEVLSETSDGQKLLAKLGPGSFFGEMGILKSQPRGASVRAETALKTLRMERAAFLATIKEDPRALSDLALITCQRLIAQVQAEA